MLGYRSTISRYILVVTFSLLILLVPFIALSFFNHPSADDFCYSSVGVEKGFLGTQEFFYQTWSGRFSATAFIGNINPLTLGVYGGYKLLALVIAAGLFVAITILIREILSGVKLRYILFLSIVAFAAYILGMPSISQGIYWYAGTATYQIGNIFFILSLALFLHINKKLSNKAKMDWRLTLLAALLIFITVGFSELLMIYTLITLVIGNIINLGYQYIKNKSISRAQIMTAAIVFFAAVLSAAILYLAPGNAVRTGTQPNPHDLSTTVNLTISETFKFVTNLNYLKPLTILALAIPVWVFIALKSNYHKQKLNWKTFMAMNSTLLLALIIEITLIYAPAIWTTGSPAADRVTNVGYLFFVLTFYAGVLLNIIFAAQLLESFGLFAKLLFKLTPVTYALITLAGFALVALIFQLGVLGSNNLKTAYLDLVTGKAYNYDTLMQQRRYATKSAKPDSEITLDPIKYDPVSIRFSELSTDPKDWTNICYSDYYGLKTSQVAKGQYND